MEAVLRELRAMALAESGGSEDWVCAADPPDDWTSCWHCIIARIDKALEPDVSLEEKRCTCAFVRDEPGPQMHAHSCALARR
jgi:hypothetical protein